MVGYLRYKNIQIKAKITSPNRSIDETFPELQFLGKQSYIGG
jgi:hypothetical protein